MSLFNKVNLFVTNHYTNNIFQEKQKTRKTQFLFLRSVIVLRLLPINFQLVFIW